MKSLFEKMGGTYRQEGDYLIPNLALPDESDYQIGKYGRMRRSYLKEHRPVLYANFLTSVCKFSYKWKAAPAPCRDRPSLQRAYGNHRFCNGEAGRCDRSTQSRQPDGMGAPHEQYPQPRGGNRSDRACI